MKRFALAAALMVAAVLAFGCTSGGTQASQNAKTFTVEDVEFTIDPCMAENNVNDLHFYYFEGDSDSNKNGEPFAFMFVYAYDSPSGKLIDKSRLVSGLHEDGVTLDYSNIKEGSIGSYKTLSFDYLSTPDDGSDARMSKSLYIQIEPDKALDISYQASSDMYEKYLQNAEATYASIKTK